MKKVSIIIPTYKRPNSLKTTVLSVINSSYKNTEIIVVDDNNPSDEGRRLTEEIMQPLLSKYKNLVYLKHEINKNGSAARNTGVRHSTGDYIMFLDDDDEFLKDKITSQIEFMENHDSSWGACYTRYIDIKDGKKVCDGCERREGNILIDELARNLFVHAGSNLMIRREIFTSIGYFDETFVRNQDVEFLVRILQKYKLGYVDIVGLVVNIHEKNYGIDYYDLTQYYLEKFTNVISVQSKDDQTRIYKMIALQQIRHSIEKSNINKFTEVKKKYKVSYLEILIYFFHLVFRLVRKKAYGFNMKRYIKV